MKKIESNILYSDYVDFNFFLYQDVRMCLNVACNKQKKEKVALPKTDFYYKIFSCQNIIIVFTFYFLIKWCRKADF